MQSIQAGFDGNAVKNISDIDMLDLQANAQIMSVGTANPETSYSQKEVLDRFKIDDRRIRLMFMNSAIDKRHLILPPMAESGEHLLESQGQLLQKHAAQGVNIGAQAILRCLEQLDATPQDIDFLCCVTTTGLLTPGLSALLIKQLNLRSDCSRVDIVGMGCHAGLNGLNTVASWVESNPGKLGIMLCAEVCSAAYVFDGTMETAVVNSLFGDGASAVALKAGESSVNQGPRILDFESCVVSEAIDAMKFDWDENHGKFNFFLAQDVPYVVGANVETVIDRLLAKAKLRRTDIDHWLVHSGGKKVVDSVKINLGLTANDLRHTSSVLRDFGNMSSGSFLFSYQRLVEENIVQPGEYAVMMTMGPGTTIETALIKF